MASSATASKLRRYALLFLITISVFHRVIATSTENHQKQPNFIIVLTDDLDLTLGGADASTLQKTRRLIADQGITVTNWFAQTPVCCPSRAELLTGRMLHNIRKPSYDAKGCMSVDVQEDLSIPFYQEYYFARHFSEALNYTVGIFGKHLNTKNPKACPRGVDRWLVNGGGNYVDPSFHWASKGVEPTNVHFDNCTDSTGMPCYSTSVIGNATIDWIKEHHQSSTERPFFALVSVKAPHLQDGDGFPKAIPAPWYVSTKIPETIAPRTPNYNLSCPDHHWLVRNQPPLTQMQGKQVDELYQTRLKSLLSVDDLVEGLVETLEELDLLQNTYLILTSDNGFRLGQFRMPEGKWHPYENDIRLPMLMRGPHLPRDGRQNPTLGTHVDLMPTLLGLATQTWNGDNDNSIVPPTMDGSNLAASLVEHATTSPSAILVEYPNLGNVVRYQHLMDTYNHTFLALRIVDSSSGDNIKYIEFFDVRVDYNMTGPFLEAEFYDLYLDPFEIHNRIHKIPHDFQRQLHDRMMALYHCKGDSCRQAATTSMLNHVAKDEAQMHIRQS